MHRAFRFFSMVFVASLATVPGASAAPQILALLETPTPTPLVCADGVCEAEFSTMCLQRDREMPRPGTAYTAADPGTIVLVVTRADGSTARIKGHPGFQFSVPRTYVSATITIGEADLDYLGAVDAAVDVEPLASLIPAPRPGDRSPLTVDEITKVTGPLRMAARRAVLREKETVGAARAAGHLANAYLYNPAPTRDGREALWRETAATAPEGPAGPGLARARRIFEVCQDYAETRGEEGFRGCLQHRHDYLMFGINHTYWHRNDVGS
ncbi:MAG: hypothetical protein ACE5GT_04270 [Rhodospirillales bacterium]